MTRAMPAHKETLLTLALRWYGRRVGRRPFLWASCWAAACCGTTIWGWYGPLLRGQQVMATYDFAAQWYVEGSRTYQNIMAWRSEHGNSKWAPRAATTIFTSRGGDTNGDVLTRDALEEVFGLYQKWRDLNVTVDHRTYTTWDLCARGNLPDVPMTCDVLETTTSPILTTMTSTVTTLTSTITATSTTATTTLGTSLAGSPGLAWEFVPVTTAVPTTTTTMDRRTTTAAVTTTTTRHCIPTPYWPCLAISPIQCFREEGELQHPSYQEFDPVIESLDPLLLPYATRPSFRELSDGAIKQSVSAPRLGEGASGGGRAGASRGCHGFTTQAFFPVDTWAGKVLWGGPDGETVARAGGLRLSLFLDGSGQIMERLRLTRPDLVDEDAIEIALRKLSQLWQWTVSKHNENITVLEAANVEPWDYVEDRIYNDLKAAKLFGYFLAVGAAAALLVCPCLLLRCGHPQASYGWHSAQGFVLVLLMMLTSSGIYFLFNLHVSVSTLIALPLLAWILGIDSVFICFRHLSQLGVEFARAETDQELLGELLAAAGPGLTLSCLCNAVTFLWALAGHVPALRDLSAGAAIITITNYLVILNVMLPLLLVEIDRIRKDRADLHPCVYPCHRWAIQKAKRAGTYDESPVLLDVEEAAPVLQVRSCFAPLLMSWGMRLLVLAVAVVLMAVAAWNIGNKRIGYDPKDAMDPADAAHRGVQLLFDHFAMFPGSLCFFNTELAGNQSAALKLYEAVTTSSFSTQGSFDNYVTTVYNLLGAGTADSMNLPDIGVATSDRNAFADLYQQLLHSPRDAAKAWLPASSNGSRASLYLDLAGASEFKYYDATNATNTSNSSSPPRIRFALMPFFAVNMATSNEYMQAVRDVQSALDSSPLKDSAFVYGPVFTHQQLLGDLEPELQAALKRYAVVICVVTLVFTSFDVSVALVTSLAGLMVLVEMYGFSMFILKFNDYFVSAMFVSIGAASELAGHFAAGLGSSEGPWLRRSGGGESATERLGSALATALPAILVGSLAAVGSALPLVLFPVPLFVQYVLFTTAILAGVVVLNAALVLPGLFAIVEPLTAAVRKWCCCCCRRRRGRHKEDD